MNCKGLVNKLVPIDKE